MISDKIRESLIFVGYFMGFILGPSVIYTIFDLIGINGSELLMSVICNLIYSVVLFIILRKDLIRDFKKLKGCLTDNLGLLFKWWGIGLGIMMASNLIINFVIFGGEIAANEESVRSLIVESTILSGISIMFLAPFTEELTFRFGLRKVFKNPWFYAITSGVIFGLLHAITGIESASDLIDLVYIIPYGSLGFAFSMLYYKTENIWMSILAHAMHNTMTFVLILLFL